MNLWVLYNAGTFLTIKGSISFSRTLFRSVTFPHLTHVLYMTIFGNTTPYYNESVVKVSNFLCYGGLKCVLLQSGSDSFMQCTNGQVPRRECILWMCLLYKINSQEGCKLDCTWNWYSCWQFQTFSCCGRDDVSATDCVVSHIFYFFTYQISCFILLKWFEVGV